MPAGNDFTNNPLWNAVVHLSDSQLTDAYGRPVRRGIAERGKPIFESSTDSAGDLLLTVERDPNPTHDGGGTVARIQYGETCNLPTDIRQGGDPLAVTLTTSFGDRLIRSIDATSELGTVFYSLAFDGSDDGSPGSPITIDFTGHSHFDGTRERIYSWSTYSDDQPAGWCAVNGEQGYVILNSAPGDPPRLHFIRYDGVEFGSVVTLGASSTLVAQGHFLYIAADVTEPITEG